MVKIDEANIDYKKGAMMSKVFEVEIKKMMNQTVRWRRYFHQYPEISNEEYQTADYLEKVIQSMDANLTVERPLPTTVTVCLKGKFPGKRIIFRADIDALPIEEQTDFSFKSVYQNRMHACGHDGHMAMLLTVLQILLGYKEQLHGEILFVFQSAEEIGGARELIKTSILDNVEAAYAVHLWPDAKVGKYQLASGPIMAAGSWFHIEIIGLGGHAGRPHQAIDPINATLDMIQSIKAQINRKIDPLVPNVLSITYIQAGDATNVIPDKLRFGGTIRTLDQRALLDLHRIINETLQTYSTLYEFSYHSEFEIDHLKEGDAPSSPLVNDEKLVNELRGNLIRNYGDCVEKFLPTLAGEDFSFYSLKVPVSFAIVGAAPNKPYPLHHPKFDFDENALEWGVRLFLTVAEGMIGREN